MQTQFALVINTLGIMQMMTIKEVHCAPPVTLLEAGKVKSLAFLLSTPTYSMADVEQVPRAVVDEPIAAVINSPADAAVLPAAKVPPAVQANEVR